MPCPKTEVLNYHAQLWIPNKGHVFKGLVVCKCWDQEPLDLLNGWLPRLLSTVSWVMNLFLQTYLFGHTFLPNKLSDYSCSTYTIYGFNNWLNANNISVVHFSIFISVSFIFLFILPLLLKIHFYNSVTVLFQYNKPWKSNVIIQLLRL